MSPTEILALNKKAQSQSVSGPATQEMVTVAVLPPRLPPGMGEADGMGVAGAVNWDENVNAQHNRLLPKHDQQLSSGKRFMKKAGLTRDRKKTHKDMPPFRMRTVPYDVWRRHYAKDKDGNYMGTHAPAEDCLLKPADVEKWSAEEPETYADTYTRGRRALPGYGDITDQDSSLPEYVEEIEGGYSGDKKGEQKDAAEATVLDASQSSEHQARPGTQGLSGRTFDGRTVEQIVAAASAREANQPKSGWRKLIP